jgi:hypothetical protein
MYTTKCYSFINPGAYILKKGSIDKFFLYSATGDKGTWHLNPSHAWEDYNKLSLENTNDNTNHQ